MEINATKVVQVNAKTFKLHVKTCDSFGGHLVDADGVQIAEYEGYVPGFFPGQHYGDYLILDIDIDTGQITNWKPPTAAQIEEFVGKCSNED